MLREGIPNAVFNCHKNLTDSNRAGQFYSRAKWPKASVLRWIGDNRPGQMRSRGEEEEKKRRRTGEEGNAKVQRRKDAKGRQKKRREGVRRESKEKEGEAGGGEE